MTMREDLEIVDMEEVVTEAVAAEVVLVEEEDMVAGGNDLFFSCIALFLHCDTVALLISFIVNILLASKIPDLSWNL